MTGSRCLQVDTAFVGRLGVLPLAALGPNAALFNVVFFIGFSALGVVATNQISSAYGCGDHAAQGRALIIACAVSIILGAPPACSHVTSRCDVWPLQEDRRQCLRSAVKRGSILVHIRLACAQSINHN